MKLLDLFCCCGGISKGFYNTGRFECTGVDIKDNHSYPYEFIHSDIFKLPLEFFGQFDLIHASPPCQGYIHTNKNKQGYERLAERTRTLLLKTGKPFIIENVPGSPVRKDLLLCGEMFNLKLIRHRIFEITGFAVMQPVHTKHKISVLNRTAVPCYSGGFKPGFWNNKERQKQFLIMRKKEPYTYTSQDYQEALGINWVEDKGHLTQMIPPKYSEYIANYF